MKLTLGTRYFMAPEMVRNPGHIEHDVKVDTWAVGVVAFYILSAGQYPFQGNNKEEVDNAILNNEPALEILRERSASDASINFIKKCLIKDPAERPSAYDMVNDFWVKDSRQFASQLTMVNSLTFMGEYTAMTPF